MPLPYELIPFLALVAALVVASWLIALRVSRRVPELQGSKQRKPKYPPRDKLQGVKVHPTDYVPITSARGNRKRDLTQMLALAGRPTSGRQRTTLRKQLARVARWEPIARDWAAVAGDFPVVLGAA
jgi:hypothetical protein